MNQTGELFLLAGIWTLVAVFIARLISGWPGRIAFLAFAVGLPFWELPYGYYNFQGLCRAEGGLRAFEPIIPQDSVCVDYPFETNALGMVEQGFKLVEARDKNGSVTRFSKKGSGEVEKKAANKITSDYCVTYAFVRGLPWRVMRNEFVVVRDSDKKLMARHSDFVWFGAWWQEAVLPVLGQGGECRHDAIGSITNALLRRK